MNFKKRIPILAIGLIILLTVGVFVFLKLQRKSTSEIGVENDIDSSKLSKDNGWRTFSASGVPYTFKYPKDINLIEEDGYHLSLWGPTQKPETEFYDGISISFSKPTKLAGQTLDEYVDKKIEYNKDLEEIVAPKRSVNINGISGITYTASGLGTVQYIFVKVPNEDSVIEIINGTKDPTGAGYDSIATSIIDSISFVD